MTDYPPVKYSRCTAIPRCLHRISHSPLSAPVSLWPPKPPILFPPYWESLAALAAQRPFYSLLALSPHPFPFLFGPGLVGGASVGEFDSV